MLVYSRPTILYLSSFLHLPRSVIISCSRIIKMSTLQSQSFSSTTPVVHQNPQLPQPRVIDMRSDTLTKPTESVRRAMYQGTRDDDVYREDTTVLQLETNMAKMWGKEAALFVPSGSMANLIAMACHCPSRGLEIIMGDRSHTFLFEQGGVSQFCGLHVRTIPNLDDGTFDLVTLEHSIRPDDPHEPKTGLIAIETTHACSGGKVLPLSFLAAVRKIADSHNLPIHMDGARALNAAVALNVEPSVMARHTDSISFCFSKGVGAPIGSVVIGSKELIARALRMRKALGAGWRKPGCLAAAALEAMRDAPERLLEDHRRAKMFAERIKSSSGSSIRVDVAGVHTNMIMVDVTAPGLSAAEFCRRMAMVGSDKPVPKGEAASAIVKVDPHHDNVVRFVVYSSLTEQDVMLAAEKLCIVLQEYTNNCVK